MRKEGTRLLPSAPGRNALILHYWHTLLWHLPLLLQGVPSKHWKSGHKNNNSAGEGGLSALQHSDILEIFDASRQ
jgi:hypothetical protein